jgi:hypothetical protein
MKIVLILVLVFGSASPAVGSDVLIPMDGEQSNHLKAYGVAFKALQEGQNVGWLLNYRGGSFVMLRSGQVRRQLRIMRVSHEELTSAKLLAIRSEIATKNMAEIWLARAPRIALYTASLTQPVDDVVDAVLRYTGIDFDIIFDADVLAGSLQDYDLVAVHHDDFTGQQGKMLGNFGHMAWYKEQTLLFTSTASEMGFPSVRELNGSVAQTIRDYVLGGGALFAMCSAAETLDIALAGRGVDFTEEEFDGTPTVPDVQAKLVYGNCLAFREFEIITDPLEYEFSSLDTTDPLNLTDPYEDAFALLDFPAKARLVPTVLTQSQAFLVPGFTGSTSGFNRRFLKEGITVLAEREGTDVVKYLYGVAGLGRFAFLGGHDPAYYTTMVGGFPTVLDRYASSPGYRLILNNVLLAAATSIGSVVPETDSIPTNVGSDADN